MKLSKQCWSEKKDMGLGIWSSPYYLGNIGQVICLWGSVFISEKHGIIVLNHTDQKKNLLEIIKRKKLYNMITIMIQLWI